MDKHCDCIKTEGGLWGFGAWCHAHKKLLDEYEFHKARDEELFGRYQSLMDQYMALKAELVRKDAQIEELKKP